MRNVVVKKRLSKKGKYGYKDAKGFYGFFNTWTDRETSEATAKRYNNKAKLIFKKEGRRATLNELYGNPYRARPTDHKKATVKGREVRKRPMQVFGTQEGKRKVFIDVNTGERYSPKVIRTRRKKNFYVACGDVNVYLYRLNERGDKIYHVLQWDIDVIMPPSHIYAWFNANQSHFNCMIDEAYKAFKNNPFALGKARLTWRLASRLQNVNTMQYNMIRSIERGRLPLHSMPFPQLKRRLLKEWDIDRDEKVALLGTHGYSMLQIESVRIMIDWLAKPADRALGNTQRGVQNIWKRR